MDGQTALATPLFVQDAPQEPVPQGKRGTLWDWPGQIRHLPPPSVGVVPSRQGGLTYSRAGGEQ